jgi:hypothetical protein
VESVILKLFSNIKITGLYPCWLKTSNIRGRGWEKEGGRVDEGVEAILGEVPNNTDIIRPLLDRKPGNHSTNLTWHNVAPSNKFT